MTANERLTKNAPTPGAPVRSVLYCRLPGLLAHAARQTRRPDEAAAPLAIADGRLVRDACPLALARGVRAGASVIQARRLCPVLLLVALEAVDHQTATRAFLDVFADLSPVVEPAGPDAAFADLDGLPAQQTEAALRALPARLQRSLGLTLAPLTGAGP